MTRPPVLVPEAGPGAAAGRTGGDHSVPCMALHERELGAQKAVWWGRAVGREADVQKLCRSVCMHSPVFIRTSFRSRSRGPGVTDPWQPGACLAADSLI